MKKGYLLKSNGSKLSTIKATVFNINESASLCSMKFPNGKVENNIPFKRVLLDSGQPLNEGLLDGFKSGIKKAADMISATFKKVGSYLVAMIDGKPAAVISPINSTIAFDKGQSNATVILPSDEAIEIAAENGIDIYGGDVESIDDHVDPAYIKSINNFWRKVMQRQNKVDESVKDSFMKVLNEKFSLEGDEETTRVPNRNFEQIKRGLMRCYRERLVKGDRAELRPYMIWGAPGIGKTTIVKDLVKEMNEVFGLKGTMICIDATAINPDDFTLPFIDKEKFRAADIPKTWFPAYNYTDTEDSAELARLDNIANGGDDDHEGSGGIIFIDELSRIRKATMQVVMKLVDQRTINNLKLGSKWLIVAAGNREEDMGDSGTLSWDYAWGSRFNNVNYVPDLEHWIEWAESVGIERDIIKFLKLNPGLWYDTDLRDGNISFANPRTWHNFDSHIKAERDLNKELGLSDTEPSDEDKYIMAGDTVGHKAAKEFQSYMRLHSKFSPEEAKAVWAEGAAAPISFRVNNPAVVKGAIEILLDNCPERITEKEINNVYSWVEKLLVESKDDAMFMTIQKAIDKYLNDNRKSLTDMSVVELNDLITNAKMTTGKRMVGNRKAALAKAKANLK